MKKIILSILIISYLFAQYSFDEWDYSEGKGKKGIKKQIITYYDIDSSGKQKLTKSDTLHYDINGFYEWIDPLSPDTLSIEKFIENDKNVKKIVTDEYTNIYTYNLNGNLEIEEYIGGYGYTTYYHYDNYQKLIRKHSYHSKSRRLPSKVNLDKMEIYKYDNNNNVIEILYPYIPEEEYPIYGIDVIDYMNQFDVDSLTISYKDKFVYDKNSNVIEEIYFDNNNLSHRRTFKYNQLNHMVERNIFEKEKEISSIKFEYEYYK